MNARTHPAGATIVAAVLLFAASGCNRLPGKPGRSGDRPETLRPDQTLGFAILYKDNCSACHGDRGSNGPALPLNNPVYLAWAGHDRMVPIVASGVSLRSMHAFAQSSGGMLTGPQVENIVLGMMAHWGKPGILNGTNPPGYAATESGDAAAGKAAFQTHCAGCHGADGAGIVPAAANDNSKQAVAGSIVDPTYLSLISTQGLRDIVVAGLPGEGMPDWRGDGSSKPMTDQEVTDVVAWLGSHRVQFPGQPFQDSSPLGVKYSTNGNETGGVPRQE